MKSSFSLGFLFVAVTFALSTFGCAGESENPLEPGVTDINHEDADWIRVDLNLESAHPYENNQEENWELQAPEHAQGIRVHFNEFETEEGKDFFVIGEHVYHGSLGSFTTDVAPGHLVPVQFSTDESVNHYGYNIDYYEYLMPHTVLRANGSHKAPETLQRVNKKLKLGSVHHARTLLNDPMAKPHHAFQDSHYEELVEEDLLYRCWGTIPFLTIPEPFVLEIKPTSLFSLNIMQEAKQVALKHATKPKSIFNGKALPMKFNIKNVQMGPQLASKVMNQTSIKTGDQPIKLKTKSIRIGFGAWQIKNFNQKHQHASVSPKLNQAQSTGFTIKPKKNGQQFFRSFKLKNLKI